MISSDRASMSCIVDVGLGNIASIERMLQKVGSRLTLAKKPDDLLGIEKVILPGVGHFDEGMKQLQKTGFAQTLVQLISDKPVYQDLEQLFKDLA